MMSKQQWVHRMMTMVLVFTLLVAVMVSARAGTNAHVTPLATVEAEAGITTIFGLSPRSLELLR